MILGPKKKSRRVFLFSFPTRAHSRPRFQGSEHDFFIFQLLEKVRVKEPNYEIDLKEELSNAQIAGGKEYYWILSSSAHFQIINEAD